VQQIDLEQSGHAKAVKVSLDGLCRCIFACRRLFAGGAGVHVDFHADRYFDDHGGLPGHFGALLVKNLTNFLYVWRALTLIKPMPLSYRWTLTLRCSALIGISLLGQIITHEGISVWLDPLTDPAATLEYFECPPYFGHWNASHLTKNPVVNSSGNRSSGEVTPHAIGNFECGWINALIGRNRVVPIELPVFLCRHDELPSLN
jgi:hypothetical protein